MIDYFLRSIQRVRWLLGLRVAFSAFSCSLLVHSFLFVPCSFFLVGASSLPFTPGEKLIFSVLYGPVEAGTATMEVLPMTMMRERLCYHFRTSAQTNSFFSFFFKVNDIVESIMDAETFSSLRFEKHLREGNFRADQWIIFEPDSNLAMYNDGRSFRTYPRVQDMLSVLYYLRTVDFGVGDTIFVPTHADRKNYPLEIVIHRTELVEVPAGTFVCYIVEPFLKTTGIFKQKGRIIVWLTRNRYKMPVRMKSEIEIGSIVANLVFYRLGDSASSGE